MTTWSSRLRVTLLALVDRDSGPVLGGPQPTTATRRLMQGWLAPGPVLDLGLSPAGRDSHLTQGRVCWGKGHLSQVNAGTPRPTAAVSPHVCPPARPPCESPLLGSPPRHGSDEKQRLPLPYLGQLSLSTDMWVRLANRLLKLLPLLHHQNVGEPESPTQTSDPPDTAGKWVQALSDRGSACWKRTLLAASVLLRQLPTLCPLSPCVQVHRQEVSAMLPLSNRRPHTLPVAFSPNRQGTGVRTPYQEM